MVLISLARQTIYEMTHSTQQSGRCDPLVLVDSISKEGAPNIQYPGPPGWGLVLEVTTLYRES